MIKSKNDYREYLKYDRIALGYDPVPTFKQRIKQFIWPDKTLQFEMALRKYEYYKNCRSKSIIGLLKYIIARWEYRKVSLQLNFTIHPNTIDYGLSLPHYGTIVINPNVRIGKFCRMHVGVNIGASGGAKKVPHIGDNVYIGPGAILFGDISIADNISVGANSTVTKSFTQPNVTIAGSPAKVIKENSPSWNFGKNILV